MKTKLLNSMRVLLVAALLGVGTSASWADGTTTVTWDFQQYVKDKGLAYQGTIGLTLGSKIGRDASNVDIFHIENFADFVLKNRFAVQNTNITFRNGSSKNEDSGKGLQNTNNARSFAILNLAVGDVVTMTTSSNALSFKGTNVTNSSAVAPSENDNVTSGEEYTVTTAGRLDMKLASQGIIHKIVLTTSATETMTAPSIAATGVKGTKRIVTITAGASSLYSNVTTYYTTDGTDPTTSSTKYTEPFEIDATTTIKAVSISTSSAATTSTVTTESVDAGTTIKLTKPTVALTSYTKFNETTLISPVFTFTSNNTSVLGAPTATLVYTFTPDGGVASEEVEIANGDTYTPTAKGTLSIYAKNADYDNSDALSLSVSSIYERNYHADLDGYTSEDLSTWTSADDWPFGTALSCPSGNPTYGRLRIGNATRTRYVIGWGFGSVNGIAFQLRNKKAGEIAEVTIHTITDGSDISALTATSFIASDGTGKDQDLYSYFYPSAYYTIKETNFFAPAALPTKTITAAGWATYCSPYILDFSSAIANLDAAYIVTGGAGGVLTKTEVTGAVPAGTGLLLKGNGECVIPVAATSTFDVTGNKLEGKTATYELAANGGYVLMNDATNGLGFYQNSNIFTVGANTAYLPAGFDGGSARSFFSFGSDATGIGSAKSEEMKDKSEVYNLKGHRVSQPTKGIYIVNGKKVVIK